MQILTFFLHQDRFAIDINLVDTIENNMPITPVPKSKKYVAGLINNRGIVMPVINTYLILGNKNIEDAFDKLIILNLESQKIALAVSDIDDVFDIEQKNIEKINDKEDLYVVNVNSNIMTLLSYQQLKKI